MAICGAGFSCIPAQNYLDPEGPKFTGQYAGPLRVFDDTIKVVSFNIKFSEQIRLATEELSNFPELRQADILLLQEMDEAGADSIARALAYNYVYYPATLHPQSHRDFGNAILAKWPLRNERKILLPHAVMGSQTRRIAVAAIVVVANFEILTYSLHTATFVQGGEKKFRQAEVIVNSVPPQQEHVIIGGDFNTLSRASFYAHGFLFRKNNFTLASSYLESTARRWPFETTLDHIFVKGLRAVAAGTARGSRASDHLPIWVKLVVEE
ncbi:MAG: endonuclease/exonuclease/phosphatase family protein [bacterium]